jgi:hypothetical protein
LDDSSRDGLDGGLGCDDGASGEGSVDVNGGVHNSRRRGNDHLLVDMHIRLEGVGLSSDDGASVFNNGLLNDVDGLNDNLLVLNLDGHLIGDLDWDFDDLCDFTGNGVRSGNVHNLLDDLLLVLDDGVGSLDGDGDWDRLVNDALNGVRHISVDDLLHGDGNLDGVGLLHLIGSGDRSVNDFGDFPNDWVRNWPVNNLVDGVGDLIGGWNVDLIRLIHDLLDNLDDGVWDGDVNNLVNGVGDWSLDDFCDGVGNLDGVTNSDFNWNLNWPGDLSSHGVRDGDGSWD